MEARRGPSSPASGRPKDEEFPLSTASFTYAIEFCTGPSMAVVYYFFNSLLCKALFDQEWKDYLPSNPILMVPFVIAQSLFFFLVVWGVPTGHLVSGLVDAAHPVKKL